MQTQSSSTAATDLYRCEIGSKFMMVAPTNLSVASTWVRALEPNDCLPITQLLGGSFSRRMVVWVDTEVPDDMGSLSPAVEYERRHTSALREGVADTLSDLAMTWGMSWVDIAKIVGVSVPALRKWRLGEARPKRDNRRRIAHIVGLLSAMKALGVAEPAGRLNVRVVDDSYLTLRDIVASAPVGDVLSYVDGNLSGEDLLDRNVSGWREQYRSKIDTYVAADGERAMRMRGSKEQ